MLPFLKIRKPDSTVIVKTKPEGGMEPEGIDGEHPAELMDAAEDLITAINMKDATAVADALKAAFVICDMYPHEEGPHTNEDY